MNRVKQTMTRLTACMFTALLIGIMLNKVAFATPQPEIGRLHSLAYLISIYCILLVPAAALASLLAWVQAGRFTQWVFLVIAAGILASAQVLMPFSGDGVGILVIYGFGLAIFSLYSAIKPLSFQESEKIGQ